MEDNLYTMQRLGDNEVNEFRIYQRTYSVTSLDLESAKFVVHFIVSKLF